MTCAAVRRVAVLLASDRTVFGGGVAAELEVGLTGRGVQDS